MKTKRYKFDGHLQIPSKVLFYKQSGTNSPDDGMWFYYHVGENDSDVGPFVSKAKAIQEYIESVLEYHERD